MKKAIVLSALACIIALFAINCNQTKVLQQDETSIYNAFCDSTDPNSPCSILPIDVNEDLSGGMSGGLGFGYDSFLDSAHQTPFDVFAWQTFIALNWPSDTSGNPTGSIYDPATAPRVWEHYSDPAQVFGHGNPSLTFYLAQAGKNGQKFFYMDSKAPVPIIKGNTVNMDEFVHPANLQGFKEADGHPLIDRNLNFALYEIKLNPIETKFIIDSNLNTLQGIYNYAQNNGNDIDLPESDSATRNPGSMEIKASWRILVPAQGDDTTRYYCRRATVYVDSAHTVNGKPLILTNVQVGLVGMHIIRKTAKVENNEIWITFEHVDNTPDNAQEAQQTARQWSFYNPLCLNCTPNDAPDTLTGDGGVYKWNTTMPYAARYGVKAPGQDLQRTFGTQVTRTYPIYKFTDMTNRLWQQKLKGSVWANYRLIGTQWQQSEINPSPTAPNFLANTTLETYIQSDASCITCHQSASVTFKNTNILTDLSFVFPVYARDTTAGIKPKK